MSAASPAAADTADRDAAKAIETVDTVEAATVAVVEEVLDVRKRFVETGAAVRLRKLVHEETVTVDEPLVTETVEVERIAIDRPVDAAVAVRQEGDVMIVPVVEERLVVRKELVLVEELRITRRRTVRHEPQEVTLRREEVVAERLDPATGRWSPIETAQRPPQEPAAA